MLNREMETVLYIVEEEKKNFQKLISQIKVLPLFIINALFLLFSLPNKAGVLCTGNK